MGTKDLFSEQSKAYAAFRPTYPAALYDFIFARVTSFDSAWDCATGNGQVARDLCKRFKHVHATDISQTQLDEAFKADNIQYSISKAEKTNFPDNSFDLITVGQALHWIDTTQFYNEVNRVGKPGSIIAVWGYSMLTISPALDELFNHFYHETVGPFWDAARRLVEEEYAGVPFPFNNRSEAKFYITGTWTREAFAGYLTSWSATQTYIQHHQRSPVPAFIESIEKLWKQGEVKPVKFPVFVKTGEVG